MVAANQSQSLVQNLTSWSSSLFQNARSQPNISETERSLSIAAGGALALIGLSRHSIGGLCTAAIGGGLLYRGISGRCHVYDALGISTLEPAAQASLAPGEGFKIEQSIHVRRPADELYRYWRNLSHLPRIFSHIKSVEQTDLLNSHWVGSAPFGSDVEWDAMVIEDKPGELISWRSRDGGDLSAAGSVHFQESAQAGETEVRVVLRYSPPGGRIGAAIAKWFDESPEQQIAAGLQEFKSMMESRV